MVLDHLLVAAGDEDEMLDPRLAGLVHDVLDHRAVDDGQHFLRDRLGGGEEAGAETGDGKHSLADAWLRRCGLKSGLLTACTKPVAS
jgi:hypothetical protein